MALGAAPSDLQGMVLREGGELVAMGIALGAIASLAVSHLLQSMLLAVNARDGLTFAIVPSILAVAALFACWLPARRVARIDPSIALRDE
jgi:putative ABC transport system permease protein